MKNSFLVHFSIMFRIVFSCLLLALLEGAYGLQCNQCSNSANNCDSPVSVTCNTANSIKTQASLAAFYNNTNVNSAPANFQCLSMNSTIESGNQNETVTVEGCVPQDFDACKLSVFSYSQEYRTSCSSCASDNCNTFNQKEVTTESPPTTDAVTQCYECDGQADCEDPHLVTCNYNSAINTLQKLMIDYTFDFASYIKNNPSSTYSCYSANISFEIAGQANIWDPLIHKGCIFDDLTPCSYSLGNQLTQTVTSCYTCDSNSCNKGSSPVAPRCYVCNSYPCLDEEVVTCNQQQVNATYEVLRDLYSNVPDQVSSDEFQCLSLQSKYSVQDKKFLGPVPIYLKGCVASSMNSCDLQVNSRASEQRNYCLQCEGDICNSNVNAPKKNATIYIEM